MPSELDGTHHFLTRQVLLFMRSVLGYAPPHQNAGPPLMSTYMRPPLKWAGGKFRLLDRILPALPPGKRLVEPFVGSGAVFLNADYPAFLLCDLNGDLIAFLKTLAERGAHFIDACAGYFGPEFNSADRYYRIREQFNTLPQGEERAALFLYLNRHAYNGLMRYNSKGKFNTPFGRYTAPYFPRVEMEAVAAKARKADITFAVTDFRQTFAALRPGDVVYCDPPYVPLSQTANFTSYTAFSFSEQDQRELSRCALTAKDNGNTVVVSNHDTAFTREIYKDAERFRFHVRRFISCDGKNRGTAQELLAVFS